MVTMEQTCSGVVTKRNHVSLGYPDDIVKMTSLQLWHKQRISEL